MPPVWLSSSNASDTSGAHSNAHGRETVCLPLLRLQGVAEVVHRPPRARAHRGEAVQVPLLCVPREAADARARARGHPSGRQTARVQIPRLHFPLSSAVGAAAPREAARGDAMFWIQRNFTVDCARCCKHCCSSGFCLRCNACQERLDNSIADSPPDSGSCDSCLTQGSSFTPLT